MTAGFRSAGSEFSEDLRSLFNLNFRQNTRATKQERRRKCSWGQESTTYFMSAEAGAKISRLRVNCFSLATLKM